MTTLVELFQLQLDAARRRRARTVLIDVTALARLVELAAAGERRTE